MRSAKWRGVWEARLEGPVRVKHRTAASPGSPKELEAGLRASVCTPCSQQPDSRHSEHGHDPASTVGWTNEGVCVHTGVSLGLKEDGN